MESTLITDTMLGYMIELKLGRLDLQSASAPAPDPGFNPSRFRCHPIHLSHSSSTSSAPHCCGSNISTLAAATIKTITEKVGYFTFIFVPQETER